jgi:predicted site-specific integrase-resolvase
MQIAKETALVEIEGVRFFAIEDLEAKKIASKSTVYRRAKKGKIKLHYSPNGKPWVKESDLGQFMKGD